MRNLSGALQGALETMLCERDVRALTRDAQAVSERYRSQTGKGTRLVTRESEAAAYAAARMPATMAAVRAALAESLAASGLGPQTLLDVGAGTGAATFAAAELLDLREITCLEREDAMRAAGEKLTRAAGLDTAEWFSRDITEETTLPCAELVVEGYMLGELTRDRRVPAAMKLYAAAQEMLVLVEPGTPQGFANLRAVRDALLEAGAYVAAPCPQCAQCPMGEGDWCHFTVRVPRTRLQKTLKGGEAPFEDEKFAYLAVTRKKPADVCESRVLRHPQIAPGLIRLTLCTAQGIRERSVTKRDGAWKQARKAAAGDAFREIRFSEEKGEMAQKT